MRRIAEIKTGLGLTGIYYANGRMIAVYPMGQQEDMDERADTEDEAVEMLIAMYGNSEWELEIL